LFVWKKSKSERASKKSIKFKKYFYINFFLSYLPYKPTSQQNKQQRKNINYKKINQISIIKLVL